MKLHNKRIKQTLLFLILAVSTCMLGCVYSGQASSTYELSEAAMESISSSLPPEINVREIIATLPEDVAVKKGKVNIKVDPMMEMLSVVQYLSGYGGLEDRHMTNIRTSYHEDIDIYFVDYKEHQAVQYFAKIMDRFNYEKPPTTCLYIEKDFSINSDYENSFLSTYNPADIEGFRDVMEQFCVDTKFNDFFKSHQSFYNETIETYSNALPTWDVLQAMETYYGTSMAEYNIVLVPLFSGGFGPYIDKDDGRHLYSIIGPSSAYENIPLFGNEAWITELIIHEWGHSFVPIAGDSAMVQEVERSEYLLEPIREKMSLLAYNHWDVVYEELVLRAAVIDITVRSSGVAAETLLQVQRNQGFIYIDDVYQVLQDYNNNRERYPTFDVFVQIITDYLIEKHPKQ